MTSAPHVTPPPHHEPSGPNRRPLSVPLADDSADLRKLYRMMLSTQGISVVAEAADGLAVVAAAQQYRPDIALVDLAMPGLDGLQVTEEIKRTLPRCRVVVQSGFEESLGGPKASAAGADRYLQKGIDAKALAETLLDLWPEREAERSPVPAYRTSCLDQTASASTAQNTATASPTGPPAAR